MDYKGKERGILKLEPRPRVVIDATKSELTPQGSYEYPPSSPQPSVDRLSVTWAEPGSMSSSGVNLFHLPSETPVSNEVKFSPSAGDGSEDEDYSASLSAVLRQRRASVRRSRKGRARRPSSPFLADENRPRRRSSVFTTSSGDTAISMEEQPAVVTQEQIFENIRLHKEVLVSVKQQPLGMRRKLKIVHQAKGYIKRHEGQLQERLAQSKSTRDIYARFNILLNTKWQQLKREAANTSNLLIPWELRIKEIESHFGSVVASYFTFLRWLFWVNLVIAVILLVFVIVPECLIANPEEDGGRKIIMEDERQNASNLLTLWEFEGVLKFSPIFYGYYSNIERPQYLMPLAYFLTGLAVYIYSFVAILRKMAENSRMSKLSEKEDECIFSWKLFTGWDYMIGNAETAHNRIASVILGFKEALLEEAEKKKDLGNWRIISRRVFVNICVIMLLVVSAYGVVTVVSRSDNNQKPQTWWRENETTIVVTLISISFPLFFELLGLLEHYHPRKQLRLQLGRIMLLNLLNLYSLIFALFSKIENMSKELDLLKPNLTMNVYNSNDSINMALNVPEVCFEKQVPCDPCNVEWVKPLSLPESITFKITASAPFTIENVCASNIGVNIPDKLSRQQRATFELNDVLEKKNEPVDTLLNIQMGNEQLKKLREFIKQQPVNFSNLNDTTESNNDEYSFYDTVSEPTVNVKDINYDYLNYDYTSTTINSNTDFQATTDYKGSKTSSADKSEDINFSENDNLISTTVIDTTNGAEKAFLSNNDNVTLTPDKETQTNTDKIFDSSMPFISYETSTYHSDINSDLRNDTDMTSSSTSSTATVTLNTIRNFTDAGITETTYSMTDTELYSNSTAFGDSLPTDSSSVTSLSDIETENLTNKPRTTTNSIISILGFDTTTDTFTSPNPQFPVGKKSDIPVISFNLTFNCGGYNITQVVFISNGAIQKLCFTRTCEFIKDDANKTNITISGDIAYKDKHERKIYNLTIGTQKKLLKLCWETMFGQELVKLTMMDLVFVFLGTLFMDFFRALLVRYLNRCWCWDLEKKFPQYGDFKIAENILHLINNQGMVWMGMFFSPGLVVLNVGKLMIMMYLRSWAVMTCNVPHEVVFRVSKSNNFYLALLLTMLFLCVIPVGHTIVRVKPSWHCGPFSEYEKIYHIITTHYIRRILPEAVNLGVNYIASPVIVIPLLALLILIIYYLTSLTSSLREANNDLKIQLRRERTEERRKMFQLADTRRRGGSSSMENTPFARWKKALPSLTMSKSIDSDDRKTLTEEANEPAKKNKKRGIFAKIVNIALEKKSTAMIPVINGSNNVDDETDTDFHENLPKEVLKIKDISVIKPDHKIKNIVETKTEGENKINNDKCPKVKLEKVDVHTDKKAVIEKQIQCEGKVIVLEELPKEKGNPKKINKTQTSQSSTQSKQSDSVGSVIPVITISTTESDDEVLSNKDKKKKSDEKDKIKHNIDRKPPKLADSKSLRRQNSVESISEQKAPAQEKKREEGPKYQYSL